MDLIMLGINGLLLLAIWRFALKKSILDHHRDQLFDLRDNLRAEFLENGWSIDSELYKRLRGLINGYLRFTERFSLIHVVLLERGIARNEVLREAQKRNIDAKFKAANPEQAAYVKELRRRALQIVMNYMIVGSGPFLLLTVALVPFVLFYLATNFVTSAIRAGSTSVAAVFTEVKGLVKATLALAAAVVAEKILMKDVVEKCSYEQVA